MAIHAPAGGNREPIDWAALRKDILSRLNILDEYKAIGVQFTGLATRSSGWRECKAFGRPDKKPSAAVNVLSGVYKCDGENAEVLGFFDFAAKYGGHADWLATLEHYADKAGVQVPFTPKEGEKGRVEAVYQYLNDSGKLVFEVVRYRRDDGSKTFRQRRPDGKGGFIPNIEGVTPVPYRLPDLLSGDRDDPVWIVEGEKDVDRLAVEGLAATTGHGGTGNTKVWEKLVGYLEGRDVYVIPDNDASGKKHAHEVAAFLIPVARMVKVVELPNLAHRGDVSEWLDAGGTIEELGALGHAAPSWSAATAPGGDDLNRDCTVADLRQTMADASWVWLQWIPNAALTLVAAEGGTGKTRFCFDLHRRIFHGLPWPDGSPATMPPGSKALWVVADNQHQEMCDISAEFGIPDDAVIINTTAGDPYGGTSLQTVEELADFEARIRREPLWGMAWGAGLYVADGARIGMMTPRRLIASGTRAGVASVRPARRTGVGNPSS